MCEPSEIGPLTRSMCESEDGGPPAIIREWGARLRNASDVIFFWMAATRRRSWLGCFTKLTDRESGTEEAESCPVRDIDPAKVERLVGPFAHSGRVRIMQALYDAPLSASDLADATGFQGGGLYHHLRELKYAAYVRDKAGQYDLTALGRQLLVTFALIARECVVDRGEEGLAVGGSWGADE